MAAEFVTVARLRSEMAKVLSELQRGGEPVYLTQRGQPRAVLLDVDHYRSLLEQLEYLDDSIEALLADERRETGGDTTTPLEKVIEQRRSGRVAVKRPRRSRASVSR